MSLNKVECWRFKDTKEYDKEIGKITIEEENDVYGIGHIKLYEDFFNSIINKKKFLTDGAEGIKALKIILGIYKSSITDQNIDLQNFEFSTYEMQGKEIKNEQ